MKNNFDSKCYGRRSLLSIILIVVGVLVLACYLGIHVKEKYMNDIYSEQEPWVNTSVNSRTGLLNL